MREIKKKEREKSVRFTKKNLKKQYKRMKSGEKERE